MIKITAAGPIGLLIAAQLFITAAIAATPPVAPSASKISNNDKDFLAVVRTNFAAWDLDHNGQLTKAEIETDMQNPLYKGDAAAALAAMKWGLEKADDASTKPPKPGQPSEKQTKVYSLAGFDQVEKTLVTGGKVVDIAFQNSLLRFGVGQKILRDHAQARGLFSAGVPHLAAIRQDWDSDCYFNSAVGSVAQASPQTIIKLIKSNPDGTFNVTYPGKPAQTVPAPTDAEIAAYTDAADGIWFNVLEKAFAKIRKIDAKLATNEPLDVATLHGGSENEILALVSGHPTKGTRFPLSSQKSADAKFLQQVRDELTAAFHDHRAVVAGKFHHAFAVVAFDPRTDTVTIHNPYDGNGLEGMPDGQGSLSSGGFLSVSTDKFVTNFKSMGVEQPAVLTH